MKYVTEEIIRRAKEGELLPLGKALNEEMTQTSSSLNDVVIRHARTDLYFQLAKAASIDYQIECDMKHYSRHCLEARKSQITAFSTGSQDSSNQTISLMSRGDES